jgi:hypothetical protein
VEAAGFQEDASPEPAPPGSLYDAFPTPTTQLEPKTRSLAAMDTDALVVFDEMPSR